jgi:hypothetical protein
MIDAARRRMIEDGLDLAICLTDLPLRIGRRPVVADASAMHRVALVSLPALGAVNLRRRAREAIVRLVAALLGDEPQRLARSVRRVDADDDDDIDARFVAAVVRGHLRLIAGMVRANRPWRLVAGLSRALAAALAAVVFALVTSDIWRVADALEWWQLVTLALGSIVATVAGLIIAHGLWERPADRASRERAVLFNVATTLTLALGVLSLYVALLLLALVGAVLLLDPSVVETTVRHDAGVGTYLRITWVIASLATVGGALGSALETDAAVREAAYGYRPERETERERSAP